MQGGGCMQRLDLTSPLAAPCNPFMFPQYCASDRNRTPCVYAPLPAPPPEFVVTAKPAAEK
jgi:hypothetical protein